MLSFLFILALVVAGYAQDLCGCEYELEIENELENRIVGGFNLDISAVPYQVSLQVAGAQHCGGSIITNKFILTAAHCIIGHEDNWNKMKVRVGSTLSNQGGQLIQVAYFHWHAQYNPSNMWHSDIAILTLDTLIQFNANVQPVRLANQETPLPIGAMALASGWGWQTEQGFNSPVHLKGAVLPIQDLSVCENAYSTPQARFYRDVQFCAGSLRGGENTCQADSGGPLVFEGIQYGIVSWGIGCARANLPTVFADVAKLRKFITVVAGI